MAAPKNHQDLEKVGYLRTQKEVTDKIKNLHKYYKDIKEGDEKSSYNRDSWPYFDLIGAVLTDKSSTGPQHLIDTTGVAQEEDTCLGTHIIYIYVVGSEKRGNIALLRKQRYGSKHVFMYFFRISFSAINPI